MRKEDILKRFTAEQLRDEASCVEETGEWLHMSLMGYMPDELRELADKAEGMEIER